MYRKGDIMSFNQSEYISNFNKNNYKRHGKHISDNTDKKSLPPRKTERIAQWDRAAKLDYRYHGADKNSALCAENINKKGFNCVNHKKSPNKSNNFKSSVHNKNENQNAEDDNCDADTRHDETENDIFLFPVFRRSRGNILHQFVLRQDLRRLERHRYRLVKNHYHRRVHDRFKKVKG